MGIRDIVLASTWGETGAAASKLFKSYDVVVVTHHIGFSQFGEQQLKEEYCKQILDKGGKIFTVTNALKIREVIAKPVEF